MLEIAWANPTFIVHEAACMNISEAKNVIESIANGLDPETNENLPDQAYLNRPQVIRALFLAVRGLDHLEQLERKGIGLADNAGKPWSGSEEASLLSDYDTGIAGKELSAKHRRTRGAIAARLVKLGRIRDRSDV